MNPLRVAAISELLMRTLPSLFPKRSMIRWNGSVSFKVSVRAIRAITMRMDGFTAVAQICWMPMNPESQDQDGCGKDMHGLESAPH